MHPSVLHVAPAAVTALARFYETLSRESLKDIARVYADDAYFKDPFNEVRGLEKIRPLFDEMFVRLDDPRFTIIEAIEQENSVVLIWDFEFRIKRLDPTRLRRIRGASHIRFAADGRVSFHRDYWDAAGELYEQLPVIGSLMRWLKKRFG